jgi:hypothetical protein
MSRTLTIAALAAALALTPAAPLRAAGVDGAPPGDQPAPQAGAPAPAAAHPATPADDSKPLFPASFKPTPAGAQQKPSPRPAETTGLGAVTATAIPLAVVIAVILLAAVVFKRAVKSGGSLAAAIGAGGRAPAGLLEVLGRYPVASGQTLVLLKLDQRVLLLSQTQRSRGHAGGFTTLSEITDPCEVASILTKVSETEGTGPASKFNALLADADGRHEPLPRPRGMARFTSMLGQQPVSWQEPEPPAPTQMETPETPAPTMRFTGVDSLRSRLAAMKSGGNA